jgi:hypothetical protein
MLYSYKKCHCRMLVCKHGKHARMRGSRKRQRARMRTLVAYQKRQRARIRTLVGSLALPIESPRFR